MIDEEGITNNFVSEVAGRLTVLPLRVPESDSDSVYRLLALMLVTLLSTCFFTMPTIIPREWLRSATASLQVTYSITRIDPS